MNKRKTILLSILGALLIAALAVGVSYAFWKVTKVQPGEANQLSTTCLNLTLESLSDNISLQAQFPIIDEEGRKLEGYTFKVTNTCDTYVTYDINLESMIDSTVSESERLNLNYLDAILDNGKIKELGSYETTDSALKQEEGTAYDTRKLKTDTIKPGTTSTPTIKEYTLRVWLDEDITGTDAMNKTWIGKISIKGWPVKVYADASGAEIPELNNGMIPVTYDTATSKWVKADTSTKWYDYNTQWWANAVTVSASSRSTYTKAVANTPIEMNDIETMWVWVPRYEYNSELLKDPNYGGTAESSGTQTQPKGIEVNFISKDTVSSSSSNFTIHDAFKWGDEDASKEQLAGIWVAKFEMSTGSTTCTPASSSVGTGCDLTTINPKIKPNVTSWRGARIGTIWTAIHESMNGTNNIYGLTNTDAHLMKNMEWGAVAYLSQSKYGKYGNSNYTGVNKEIYQNKSSSFITGSSNGTPSSSTTNTQIAYNVEGSGTGASTTGNIYGIYDMSGGAYEYVMGIQKVNGFNEPAVGYDSSYNSGWSGKLWNGTSYIGTYDRLGDDPSTTEETEGIGKRYYDLYEYSDNYKDYTRAHKGDATYEVSGWYSDCKSFVHSVYLFFERGSDYSRGADAGVFSFSNNGGYAGSSNGGRPVAVHTS